MAYSINNDEAEQMAAMWQNEAEIAQAKVEELEQQLEEAQSKVKKLGLFSVSQQRELLYGFITWYNAKPKVQKGEHVYTTDVDEFLKP